MIDVDYEEGTTAPTLELYLPKAMEGTDAARTLTQLASVFDQALKLANDKERTYGRAWSKQGWMGNFARLQSKMSRLRNMIWRDTPLADSNESVTDTALDFVNLSAFFVINRSEDNRWGGN
jgi:hypothetical protein